MRRGACGSHRAFWPPRPCSNSATGATVLSCDEAPSLLGWPLLPSAWLRLLDSSLRGLRGKPSSACSACNCATIAPAVIAQGRTPLHIAVEEGHPNAVERLATADTVKVQSEVRPSVSQLPQPHAPIRSRLKPLILYAW